MFRNAGKVLFIIAAVFWSGLAFAGHPLATDDSGTQGKGNYQFEFTGEYETTDEAGIVTRESEVAATLTYGLAESLDLAVGIPYDSFSGLSETGEKATEQGGSDMSLAAKWRFFERDGLSVAAKGAITLPTGTEDKGRGTGKVTYSAVCIVTKDLKPLAVHANVGYLRNESDFDERRDIWFASLAAEYSVSDSVKIVANVGQERNADKTSDVNPFFVLGGVVYAVNDKFDVDLGYKSGLNDTEADQAILGGITLRF